MEWLWTALAMVAMVPAAIVSITWFQRSLGRPGGRGSLGALGGAVSGLEAVFNPEAARARADREEQTRQRAPVPSPGDLPPGVSLDSDDDGVPIRVTIRTNNSTGAAGTHAASEVGLQRNPSGSHADRDDEPSNGGERGGPAGPAGTQR